MITWLDDQEGRGAHPASFQEFSGFLESVGNRDAFNERELRGAAEHLQRHELIESAHVEEFPEGWIAPRLTVKGRECITDYGGDVAEYVRDRRGAGSPTNTIGALADDIWST
jgi:hypothetical protein